MPRTCESFARQCRLIINETAAKVKSEPLDLVWWTDEGTLYSRELQAPTPPEQPMKTDLISQAARDRVTVPDGLYLDIAHSIAHSAYLIFIANEPIPNELRRAATDMVRKAEYLKFQTDADKLVDLVATKAQKLIDQFQEQQTWRDRPPML